MSRVLKIIILLLVALLAGTPNTAQPETIPIQQITVNFRPFRVAWSPDGENIAVGAELGTHLYTTSLQEITFFPGDAIAGISWSPSGNQIVAGGGFYSGQGQIQIFERDSTTNEFSLKDTLVNSHEDVIDVEWSPNGLLLATLSRDSEDGLDPIIHTTEIWNTSDWSLFMTLKHQYLEGFYNLSWSPDSTRIAGTGTEYICDGVFCSPNDQEKYAAGVFIADVNTGERLFVLGDESPSSITWSSNNKLAVNWPELIVYDPDTGTPINVLTSAVHRIKWHPSGNGIAYMSALDRINIQDDVGQLIFEIATESSLWDFDWNPDGTRLVTVTENGVIQIWDTSSLRTIACNITIPASDTASLISAIASANSAGTPQTLCLTDSTYTLDTVPAITGDITILGNGATIEFASGGFHVAAEGELTLRDVSVRSE